MRLLFLGLFLSLTTFNLSAQGVVAPMGQAQLFNYEQEEKEWQELNGEAPQKQSPWPVDVSFSMVSVLQNALDANAMEDGEDVLDFSYSLDVEVQYEFSDRDAKVYMSLTTADGDGADDELNAFVGSNGDASDDDNTLTIDQFAYEQSLMDGKATVTVGRIDATSFFDENEVANSEDEQFLSPMFINDPTIEFPEVGIGAAGSYQINDHLTATVGVFDSDGDGEDVADGTFMMAQLALSHQNFQKRPGNVRVYTWRNNSAHTRWDDATKDAENSFGFGFNLDQEIHDHMIAFFRYGWQNPEVFLNGSDFSLEHAWSAGVRIDGTWWGRPKDHLGFAIGQVFPSSDFTDADPLNGGKSEEHVEIYYSYAVNEYFTITPDFQWIHDPAGGGSSESSNNRVSIFSIRSHLVF